VALFLQFGKLAFKIRNNGLVLEYIILFVNHESLQLFISIFGLVALDSNNFLFFLIVFFELLNLFLKPIFKNLSFVFYDLAN
jgi:hypothetical protein